MTVGEMLERSVQRFPDKTAIVFKDRQVKYKDLNVDSNRLGRALIALGISRDDKVGILMPNCPEFVVGVFAALKAGAVFVALNALLSGRELTYVITNSDAKVIIAAPPYDELLVHLHPKLPKVKHIITLDENPEETNLLSYSLLMEPHEGSNLKPSVSLEDIAAIDYTAGTTGLPKGAMLTHENILSTTVAIGKAILASRKDVLLTCIPMFHTLALTACIMVPIFGGMSNVLLEKFFPHPVLQVFNDWKISIFVGIPKMFSILANMPHIERYDVSHLRWGYCIEAPLTESVAEEFESKFSCTLYEGYGLAECSSLVSLNPRNQRKIGSIGKPVDRVSWKIVDQNGNEVLPNTVGEIAVSGPNVMKKYYKSEEATNQSLRGKEGCEITDEVLTNLGKKGVPHEVLQDLATLKGKEFIKEPQFLYTVEKRIGKGYAVKYQDLILQCTRRRWFYTGDLAYMDEDGFVFITDRKEDMIIVGGEYVYPKEIENVFTQYPGIEDAGVIRIEDPIRGEVLKAYIVKKIGVSVDKKDILAFCRKYLAPFKVPRSIEIIDEIPKNFTGKILKWVLRRIAAGLPVDEAEEDFEENFKEPRDVSTILKNKIESGNYDVFLCHNSQDKPAVKDIGVQLKKQGILPWLDVWELRPGFPWQRVLEEQIANIRSVAIFIGSSGIGPWQNMELDAFIREFLNRKCPVIPVILIGCKGEPELPIFLKSMTWIDFRKQDPDPLELLIWGITGKRITVR